MSFSGIFLTGSDANYHFPVRSLLSARSESATKNPQILELRRPSSGRNQRSRLQRSVSPKAFGVMPAGARVKKTQFLVRGNPGEHPRKEEAGRKGNVWFHPRLGKLNMTRGWRWRLRAGL